MIGIINENTIDLLTDVQLVTAMRHKTNTINKRWSLRLIEEKIKDHQLLVYYTSDIRLLFTIDMELALNYCNN